MNLTELAHWECRCSILQSELASCKVTMRHLLGDPYLSEDISDLRNQIDCMRWLLAEAQYKTTLGRLEQEYGSQAD